MTNKGEVYVSLLEKIASMVKDLKDENGVRKFKDVILGWKTPAKRFPTAFIMPHPFPIAPVTGKASTYSFDLLVMVVTEDSNLTRGMKSAISLAGDVEEVLTADRTLGGLVDNLEVNNYEMEWEALRGYLRHYATLIIECRKLM